MCTIWSSSGLVNNELFALKPAVINTKPICQIYDIDEQDIPDKSSIASNSCANSEQRAIRSYLRDAKLLII